MGEKKKVGRPRKITDEVIRKLEDAFLAGATDLEACCHANISKTVLYDYCQENPKFAERKETLKNSPVLRAKMIINDSLREGDLLTANKVVDRKEAREAKKIDITSGGNAIKNNFIIQPVTTALDNDN